MIDEVVYYPSPYVINPAPQLTASEEFNIASLCNYLELSPNKAKQFLINKTTLDDLEMGLLSVLEYKLNNIVSAREWSLKAISVASDSSPLWIANNEANFLWEHDKKQTEAEDLWDKIGKSYQQIFWNDEPFGIIKDRNSSHEWFINDEIPLILPPDLGCYILNAGAVKLLGENFIQHAIDKAKPQYSMDFHYSDKDTKMNIVHVGEAVISFDACEYLGGRDAVDRCQEAGRARLFHGIKLFKSLISKAIDEFNLDKIDNKI